MILSKKSNNLGPHITAGDMKNFSVEGHRVVYFDIFVSIVLASCVFFRQSLSSNEFSLGNSARKLKFTLKGSAMKTRIAKLFSLIFFSSVSQKSCQKI